MFSQLQNSAQSFVTSMATMGVLPSIFVTKKVLEIMDVHSYKEEGTETMLGIINPVGFIPGILSAAGGVILCPLYASYVQLLRSRTRLCDKEIHWLQNRGTDIINSVTKNDFLRIREHSLYQTSFASSKSSTKLMNELNDKRRKTKHKKSSLKEYISLPLSHNGKKLFNIIFTTLFLYDTIIQQTLFIENMPYKAISIIKSYVT